MRPPLENPQFNTRGLIARVALKYGMKLGEEPRRKDAREKAGLLGEGRASSPCPPGGAGIRA